MRRRYIITALMVGLVLAIFCFTQAVGALSSDKDLGNSLPDPDRNYYGKCGNLYNYQGHLIKKGKGCKKHHAKKHHHAVKAPYFKGK
jgi:hypothetical protein